MLRGDLATTPLDEVLRLLADERATGRLALRESGNGEQARTAEIYVATGEIYAAWLAEPDADPVTAADARLQLRLLAEKTLQPDAWQDAVAAQEELFDWSVGELLVELGHLERAALERVAIEELLDAVSQAQGWKFGSYLFRRRERTRNRAGRTYAVSDLLEAITERRADRDRLEVPAAAVPSLGDGESTASGLEAAVLGLVDGVRSVVELELASGCTGLEVARALRSLADRGCVVLPEPVPELSVALVTEPASLDEQDPVSRWSALLDATLPPADDAPRSTVERVRSDLPPRPVEQLDPETAQRRARLRARAAEELLAAQAEAEALREMELARLALGSGHANGHGNGAGDGLAVGENLSVIEMLSLVQATDVAEPDSAQAAPIEAVEASEPATPDESESEHLGSDHAIVDEGALAETPADEVATDLATDDVAAEVPAEVTAAEEVPTDEVPAEGMPAGEVPAEGMPAGEVPAESLAVDRDMVSETTEADSLWLTDDLVADDLLVAELPLAEPASVTAASESTLVVPSDVAAAAEPEPELLQSADDDPHEDAGDPNDEHDPALAAVLLRELSSLGLDVEPAAEAPRTPRVPAPRQAATAARKKRGIFGR